MLPYDCWEYQTTAFPWYQGTLQEWLNNLGKQGWELAATHKNSSDDVVYYFKRRIPPKETSYREPG